MRDQLITDMATQLAERPDKAGQVRRSTATLKTWNPAELRGSVDWNGTIIYDIPVIGALDAFSWQAGDEVIVDSVPGTDGGFSSPTILGRVLRPSAASAAKVLQALQTEFARQISAEIFAQRIHPAVVAARENTTSDTFTNLSTVGPTASDVSVSTGVAVVFVAAVIETSISQNSSPNLEVGYMGVQVSGATSVSPIEQQSLQFGNSLSGAVLDVQQLQFPRAANVHVFTDLNPGAHTFQAKYRKFGTNAQPWFSNRELVVIAL